MPKKKKKTVKDKLNETKQDIKKNARDYIDRKNEQKYLKEEEKDETHKKPRRTPLWVILLIFTFAMMVSALISLYSSYEKITYDEVSYSQFSELLAEGEIKSVLLNNSTIWFVTEDGERFMTYRLDDQDLTQKLLDAEVEVERSTAKDYSENLAGQVVSLIFYIIMFVFLFGMMYSRQRGRRGWLVKEAPDVHFSDVAGQQEAKDSLAEIVDFLTNAEHYAETGAKLPKGALLVGPPGTGKTLLAKAVAGEANVPFYSLSGSDFVEMYVGMGASRVRSLFRQAKQNAPCIIFIDEIDAIAKRRGINGGNSEQEQTLNQLLTEMDGFHTDSGIVMLGATNRPECLDAAIMRPGRFDRIIEVELPDLSEREAILDVHLRDVKYDDEVNTHDLALQTAGMSGADLAGMVNEAAIRAVSEGRTYVCQADLTASIETVLVGKEKQSRTLNDYEKRIVATHETGHALASVVQTHKQPVQKISIIPRTRGTLGFVMQVPEDETYLKNFNELNAEIVSTLAGRAAEEVRFGKDAVTTGASNDLEKATDLARSIVAKYGLYDSLSCVMKQEGQYLNGEYRMGCSDIKQAQIDDAVDRILNDAYKTAKSILEENREELIALSDFLFEHESITGDEFMELLNNFGHDYESADIK